MSVVERQFDQVLEAAPFDPLIELDHQLLTELVQLVPFESADVAQLEPTVRQMMLDRIFAGECGDCIVGKYFDEHFNQLVDQVMQWLEEVRQGAAGSQADIIDKAKGDCHGWS